VFIESLQQAIDFQSCIKATFKDANEVSDGTFSTTYKAVMPSGMVVCVKKLKSVDRAVIHQQEKMVRELERFSHINHKNLVRPIGFVIYDDVALLLHHHMPNGTLLQLLHNGGDTDGEKQKPDWPRLLSIAIDVAEGLAFLHQVATIHLDICSGNVFLDSHYNALLGEVEISKLLDPSKGTASISAVAGSFGYIPPGLNSVQHLVAILEVVLWMSTTMNNRLPFCNWFLAEYAYTMQVTVPGNVYSYGVVLLEILTSKLPVDEVFGEGVDLVKWVHAAPARGETPEQIMDPRLSTVSFAWRRQMLAVLKVAMLCTERAPAKRPRMKKVVEMLQEAKNS
jgi:serine/threonine protein kinase